MTGRAASTKGKRRERSDGNGAEAAAKGATEEPEATTAAATVVADNGAESSGKTKKKKRRKRVQTRGDNGESEIEPDLGLAKSVGCQERKTADGAKRPKKSADAPAPSAADAAIVAGGTSAVGAAGLSPQPFPRTCTSKVAEYAAVCGGGSGVERTRSVLEARKKKKKPKDKRHKKNDRGTSSNQLTQTSVSNQGGDDTPAYKYDDGADDGDDQEGPVLEGIFHDGAMYLVDGRGNVFSAERDERGGLVEVGTFDENRRQVVMNEQSTSGVPANTMESAATAKGEVETPSNRHGSAPPGVIAAGSSKQKKRKKTAKGVEDGAKTDGSAGTGAVDVVEYPYEVEECDHCETSERAYADIAPLLSALAAELGKTPEELVIYDPYYCQGSTVRRLASLGFPRVYNRKEDFYKVVKDGVVPEHDVVVTNPPFSGDHVPKILSFCARNGGKPWFLLMPNYVYLKNYYESSLGRSPGGGTTLPFYLTPPKRYMYYSPARSRLKVKSSERKTSPFNTFWYISLGDGHTTSKEVYAYAKPRSLAGSVVHTRSFFEAQILQSYDVVSRKADKGAKCCIARTTQQIPFKMMDSNDPRRKKARDRQRSIDRIRKKQS